MMKYDLDEAVVCVIGLGCVGMPLAEALSQSLEVIGFDSNVEKVSRVLAQQSASQDSVIDAHLTFTTDSQEVSKATFIIIGVPAPLTPSKEPGLSHVKNAAETAGRNMKRGAIVILESTVFPGVTEEIVKPILEEESNLKCGEDFRIAYSPERINPGDKQHSMDKITKVVAGMDEETTELIAKLYRKITPSYFQG